MQHFLQVCKYWTKSNLTDIYYYDAAMRCVVVARSSTPPLKPYALFMLGGAKL